MKIQEFYCDSSSKNPTLADDNPDIRCVNMELKEEGMILPRLTN